MKPPHTVRFAFISCLTSMQRKLRIAALLIACVVAFLIASDRAFTLTGGADSYALFEQPGRMIPLPEGNRLSMYCVGSGGPTVILETGFGGGAYSAWHELQPRLGKVTRTCSYDRAGYGFSELGNDLPRDLKHDVADLHNLLKASGEPGPYILVGHSDGGRIIGAFADSFQSETAGMVFLDAAVLLEKEVRRQPQALSPELKKYFDDQLGNIRACLKRAQATTEPFQARPGDFCLNSDWPTDMPPRMREAAAQMAARPDNWRAFLSEAEQHYIVNDDTWAMSLLPHHWQSIPIRVFTASVASLDDEQSAASYGLPITDHKALAEARAGRKVWEALQGRICEFSKNCQSNLIPTAQHEVQNAVPDQVTASIRTLVSEVRNERRGKLYNRSRTPDLPVGLQCAPASCAGNAETSEDIRHALRYQDLSR